MLGSFLIYFATNGNELLNKDLDSHRLEKYSSLYEVNCFPRNSVLHSVLAFLSRLYTFKAVFLQMGHVFFSNSHFMIHSEW